MNRMNKTREQWLEYRNGNQTGRDDFYDCVWDVIRLYDEVSKLKKENALLRDPDRHTRFVQITLQRDEARQEAEQLKEENARLTAQLALSEAKVSSLEHDYEDMTLEYRKRRDELFSQLAEREDAHRHGQHLIDTAKAWGRADDDGEGPFNFVTRKTYEQGRDDALARFHVAEGER